MKINLNYKKILKFFPWIILSFFLIIFFIDQSHIKILKSYIIKKLPNRMQIVLELLDNPSEYLSRTRNDYNVKFLPETQNTNISFEKIKIKNLSNNYESLFYSTTLERYTFFLEIYKDKIIIIDNAGKVFFTNLKNNNYIFKQINNNMRVQKILDFKIKNDFLYISSVIKKNECNELAIMKGKINYENIILEKIFESNECVNDIGAGKINFLKNENQFNLIFTTSGDLLKNKDQSDRKPQDDNSIYGKIIQFNEYDKTYKIFSKGHRNTLGIYSDDVILTTDNGPKGGDEINKIEKNKNYGWPISSYGKKYFSKHNEGIYKSHSEKKFQEPIFVFLKGMGITEIIKIDNNFNDNWNNNFLIGTLNHKHLIRVRFNKEFTKLIYKEHIFINERIRDLAYYKKDKKIFLALESTGSLGVITNY